MAMRPGSLAILGITAYSVFLVATLPARWAAERMGVRGNLALHSVEGTIWMPTEEFTQVFTGELIVFRK